MTDNMKLWDSVFQTDPAHTKGFTKGGGFKGTAIKPFWLIKRATEVFGPVGIGWGWEELENQMVGGVWCSKVRLWYCLSGDPAAPHFKHGDAMGRIEQWGQTVMVGTNKNGEFVDEEAPKKAVTDAVTKCLSYLGFGGDVHMGLFDDSKYVEHAAKQQKVYRTAKDAQNRAKSIETDLIESSDLVQLQGVWKDNWPHIKVISQQEGGEEWLAHITRVKDNRKRELEDAAAQAAIEDYNLDPEGMYND